METVLIAVIAAPLVILLAGITLFAYQEERLRRHRNEGQSGVARRDRGQWVRHPLKTLWVSTEERRRRKRFWRFVAALVAGIALWGYWVGVGIMEGFNVLYFPLLTALVAIGAAVGIFVTNWFWGRRGL